MRERMRVALAAGVLCASSIGLAGCGVVGGEKETPRSASRAVPRPIPIETRPAPAPAPVRKAAIPRREVWQLRAGLNVAALSCRGRGKPQLSGHYSRLLSRHRLLLDETYKAEVRRHGLNDFDRQQTRMYNRFAKQKSPAKFCGVAAEVAKLAVAMDSASLSPAASGLVKDLERGLR